MHEYCDMPLSFSIIFTRIDSYGNGRKVPLGKYSASFSNDCNGEASIRPKTLVRDAKIVRLAVYVSKLNVYIHSLLYLL